MNNLLQKFLSNEDGNIGLMGVIGGVTVLSASALAIESNMLFGSQTSLQSALDSATLAAAGVEADAQDAIAREVFDLAVGDIDIDFGTDGVDITRQGEFLVGTATGTVDTLFGGVLMPETVTVSARSVVGFTREVGGETAGSPACIITLDSNNGVTYNGGNMQAPDCEVHVHGTGTPISYNGGDVNVSKICIAGDRFGNNNNPRISEDQFELNCDVAPDPYADIVPVAANNQPCVSQEQNLNGNAPRVFTPGRYCQGVNVNGQADIHFQPGVYFLDQSWNVNGGNWTGDGVTFVFNQNGNIQFNSNFGGLEMSAPTDGDHAGLFMVDVTSSNGYQLNGGNKLNITGAIYMPRRQFTYNSGSESSTSATNGFNPGFNFVVGSMHINNGSTLRIEPTDLTPVAPGSGRGAGVDDGGGVDVERVSSSEGLPFLAE